MRTITRTEKPHTKKMPPGICRAESISKEIGAIRNCLDISAERLGTMLQVSSRTVIRWEEAKHSPTNPNQQINISKLKEIVELGCMVYTAEGLREFLFKPQPVFKGHTAFQLISIGDYETVLGAIAADYEGAVF